MNGQACEPTGSVCELTHGSSALTTRSSPAFSSRTTVQGQITASSIPPPNCDSPRQRSGDSQLASMLSQHWPASALSPHFTSPMGSETEGNDAE